MAHSRESHGNSLTSPFPELSTKFRHFVDKPKKPQQKQASEILAEATQDKKGRTRTREDAVKVMRGLSWVRRAEEQVEVNMLNAHGQLPADTSSDPALANTK